MLRGGSPRTGRQERVLSASPSQQIDSRGGVGRWGSARGASRLLRRWRPAGEAPRGGCRTAWTGMMVLISTFLCMKLDMSIECRRAASPSQKLPCSKVTFVLVRVVGAKLRPIWRSPAALVLQGGTRMSFLISSVVARLLSISGAAACVRKMVLVTSATRDVKSPVISVEDAIVLHRHTGRRGSGEVLLLFFGMSGFY